MIIQRIQWLMAVALMCVVAGPVLTAKGQARPIDNASFGLKSGARVTAFNPKTDERVRARFVGKGGAKVSADGVSLRLGPLTQVDGDGTLTVTPRGDLKRRGKSRVFFGKGTAIAESNGVTTTFQNVRIVVKFRGQGHRLRLIGKFGGKNGPVADTDAQTPPAVLHGRFRGQRVAPEPDPA